MFPFETKQRSLRSQHTRDHGFDDDDDDDDGDDDDDDEEVVMSQYLSSTHTTAVAQTPGISPVVSLCLVDSLVSVPLSRGSIYQRYRLMKKKKRTNSMSTSDRRLCQRGTSCECTRHSEQYVRNTWQQPPETLVGSLRLLPLLSPVR